MPNIEPRLAVCSWSLQPDSTEALIESMQRIGLNRIQIALDPIREDEKNWRSFSEDIAAAGMELVSGMFVTVGEDYSTLETIKETGGVVPDQHWEENWKNIRANAKLARELGLKLVTFHAGFLPHEESDPQFAKLLDRIGQIADCFEKEGIELAFETGQETAETLRIFLEKLDRRSVGVNFDPANMILYDKGDPIDALRTLAPSLKQCHIKDGTRTKTPGQWGEEVTVGTGEVDWNAFLATLKELGYAGDLCIEREAGTQRIEDIRTARSYIAGMA